MWIDGWFCAYFEVTIFLSDFRGSEVQISKDHLCRPIPGGYTDELISFSCLFTFLLAIFCPHLDLGLDPVAHYKTPQPFPT